MLGVNFTTRALTTTRRARKRPPPPSRLQPLPSLARPAAMLAPRPLVLTGRPCPRRTTTLTCVAAGLADGNLDLRVNGKARGLMRVPPLRTRPGLTRKSLSSRSIMAAGSAAD